MSFRESEGSPPYEGENTTLPVPVAQVSPSTPSAGSAESRSGMYSDGKEHHHHRHHRHDRHSQHEKGEANRPSDGYLLSSSDANPEDVSSGAPAVLASRQQQRVSSSSPLSPPTPVAAGSKWPSMPNAYQSRRFQLKPPSSEPGALPSTPRSANNSPRYRQQVHPQQSQQPQPQQQQQQQQPQQQPQPQLQLQQQQRLPAQPQPAQQLQPQNLYIEVPKESHTPDEPSYDELADDFVKMLSLSGTPSVTPITSPSYPNPVPISPSTETYSSSPNSPQTTHIVPVTYSPRTTVGGGGGHIRVQSLQGPTTEAPVHPLILHRAYQGSAPNLGKGRVNVPGHVYPTPSQTIQVQHPQPQVIHGDFGYAPAPSFLPGSMSPTLISSQKASFLMQQPDGKLSPEIAPIPDYPQRPYSQLRTVNGVVTRGRCLSQDYGETSYLDSAPVMFHPQVVTIPRKAPGPPAPPGPVLVYPNSGIPQPQQLAPPQQQQQDPGTPAIYPIPLREDAVESPGIEDNLSPTTSQQSFGVSTPSLPYGPYSNSSTAASATSDAFDPANAMGNTLEDLECEEFREDVGSSRGSSSDPREDEPDADDSESVVPFSETVDDGYYTPEEAQMYERKPSRVDNNEDTSIRWQKGKAIGSGAFGTVYLGMNTDTGKLLAVKTVPIVHLDEDSKELKNFRDEVAVMRGLHHENIVKYLGMEVTSDSLNIFLEYIPCGSIASLIKKVGVLGDQIIRIYVRQILSGLMYLHNYHIVHRDIKGSNILVDHNGVIKLTDFGASKRLEELVSANGSQSLKGTPNWMAPEVISKNIYCRQNDIWGVGCTIIEMATGKPPWSDHKDQMSVLFAIARTKDPPPFPDSLSPTGKEFLGLCLRVNHMERPNAATLLQHPWMHVTVKKSESPRGDCSSSGTSSSTPSSTSTMTPPVLSPGLAGSCTSTPGLTPSVGVPQRVLLTPLTSPLTCSTTTSDTSPLPANGTLTGSLIYRSGSQQFINGNPLEGNEERAWVEQPGFSRKLSQQQLQQIASGFAPGQTNSLPRDIGALMKQQIPSQTYSPTIHPQVLPGSQQYITPLQSPRHSVDGWPAGYGPQKQQGQPPVKPSEETRPRRNSAGFGPSLTISFQNSMSQPPPRPIHQSASVLSMSAYQTAPNQQPQQSMGGLQVPVAPYARHSRSPSPYDTPVGGFLPDSLSEHTLFNGNY